ncbi:hypothetical protein CBL_05423 [Carabus blaptoides fortunei]
MPIIHYQKYLFLPLWCNVWVKVPQQVNQTVLEDHPHHRMETTLHHRHHRMETADMDHITMVHITMVHIHTVHITMVHTHLTHRQQILHNTMATPKRKLFRCYTNFSVWVKPPQLDQQIQHGIKNLLCPALLLYGLDLSGSSALPPFG